MDVSYGTSAIQESRGFVKHGVWGYDVSGGLPYDCRTFILQIMSDTLAMYDVICMRSLMFIKRCFSCESDVVRFIAQCSVLYGGMVSCIGRCHTHSSTTLRATIGL